MKEYCAMHTIEQAFSTMSYFFLQYTVGAYKNNYDTQELIKQELSDFLTNFNEECPTFSPKLQRILLSEIIQDDYYEDMPNDEITQCINQSIHDICGEDLPNIAPFFIQLLTQAGTNTPRHTLMRHADGHEETVLHTSLRYYELRQMGYKEIKQIP